MHHAADSTVLDQEPHVLSTEELDGLFFSNDDQKAKYRAAAQIYVIGETRVYGQGYEVYTFDDGSTLSLRIGMRKEGEVGDSYSGGIEVLNGTGRYRGVSGSGTFTGWSNGYNAFHDIEISFD